MIRLPGLLALFLGFGACGHSSVIRGARVVASMAIACDASQTTHVAARGWPGTTHESGNAGRIIGETPSPAVVGTYMAAYLGAVLASSELLPRKWRAPVLVGVAAWHMTAVVPNHAIAGGACGFGGG